MSLRDQPYLPFYVQDFASDEKLMECSASATGVYIRIICLMHKSEDYGKIILKQKDKQSDNQIKNFASRIAKHLPYAYETVFEGLSELLSECVLRIEGDTLFQKRMVKDGEISLKRSLSGRIGGENATKKKINEPNDEANYQANADTDIEDVIVIEDGIKKDAVKVKKHNVSMPFNGTFEPVWEEWKKYKKAQHNFQYKNGGSEQAALHELVSLAYSNEKTAIAIIQQSMANGWKGFFSLKNNNNGNTATGKQPTGGNVDTRSAFQKIDDFHAKNGSR